MPVSTAAVPPPWSTPNSVSSPAALDDLKLQFVTEEVRKRFPDISMTEMLAVLNTLLTDPRIYECGGGQACGAMKKSTNRLPLVLGLRRNNASTGAEQNSTSRLQQQGCANSFIMARELSLPEWSTRGREIDSIPNLNVPAASRLSTEWTTIVASILDNALQCRGLANEHHTVVDTVQLSIQGWFDGASVEVARSKKMHAAAGSAASDPSAWVATLTQVRRLAEDVCHSKYDAVYKRLCSEAAEDGDEEMTTPVYAMHNDDSAMESSSVVARQSVHRSASGPVGIPPFSLVIQCGRDGSRTEVPDSSLPIDLARHGSTYGSGSEESTSSFVVGCEWFQWMFLVQSPLACQSEPYPGLEDGATGKGAEAVAVEQQKWRQRHCTVQLLYPSEAGFSEGSDESSGLRSAEAQYELSEPHVVLSSLLGVAMRVWCQNHPHIVAQVLQLEEDTYPCRIYDGSLFWSVWPLRDPAAQGQCECDAVGDSMPIPLLPGECFAHESDVKDEEDN
ncbi:hypothetical protein, unknown function [Leishmania tarentolae]|uniref:Uncharacterized protein n=1 Tax=Leishmania tarentolae TaxID=5689 RepID=A0A640KSY6_LEITA|nr:hypothetical protein, unknown function [Leishmania tarentolae]